MKTEDSTMPNMAGGANHMSMDMGMSMTFHTGYAETILFQGVKTRNIAEIIGACVIVFCIALLYEGLKVLREEIIERYQKKKKCDTEANQLKIKIFLWPHILQTCMHIIQMTVSYFLMLIFMTYNVWLCLAVALGAGAGYFAFRWKRPFNALEASEHCH